MNDVLIRLVASLVVILLFCFFFSICVENKDNENKLLLQILNKIFLYGSITIVISLIIIIWNG